MKDELNSARHISPAFINHVHIHKYYIHIKHEIKILMQY